MLERELTNELHRVANAAPVPDDLFPAATRLQRGGAHRSWAIAVAAAVALVAFGFSPLGQKVVDATTQWVMTYTVNVHWGQAPSGGVDQRTIQIGQTVEEKHKSGSREVHRGVAVADLTGWSLPTYLAPDPAGTAVLTELYVPNQDEVWATHLMVYYEVPGFDQGFINYQQSRGGVTARQLDEIRSGKLPGAEIYGLKPDHVTQQTVSIKGHEATATLMGKTWMLQWWHEGGSGHLSSNLPLEELVKVAESLPSLE
jgi:hypothetical protein